MNNDFVNIRHAADSGKLMPSKHVWNRIESRLQIEDQESKIKTLSYQKMILSIASCVLLMVSVYAFSSNLNSEYSAGELAQLEPSQSDIYSINNVRKVNSLYK